MKIKFAGNQDFQLDAIRKSLHDLMVQGIEYECIADADWKLHRLES